MQVPRNAIELDRQLQDTLILARKINMKALEQEIKRPIKAEKRNEKGILIAL